MARFLKKKDKSIGMVPGEPVFIGEQKVEAVALKLFDYTKDELHEHVLDNHLGLAGYLGTKSVSWINVNGLHDIEIIRSVAEQLDIHPLTLEDIVNTGERPKMDDYGDYLFFTLRMLQYDEQKHEVISEQLSFLLWKNHLLSFQERPGDVLDPVRDRIRNSRGRIRSMGPDYLLYALLDSVVDKYIMTIELLGAQIEELEQDLLENQDDHIVERINDFKLEINFLRKNVRPVREFMVRLALLDSDLLRKEVRPFLKDLADLATQATETLDSYKDMLSDHLNIYNTRIGNRLNEIMKVLTIFAAIFIPLTFIAGIYGTNFEYLPELQYRYSYFIFWGVMVAVAVAMLFYFRRKKWL